MNLIKLTCGSTTVVLQGSGMAAPCRGAVMVPATGAGETVEEQITVSLEGTASAIEGVITSVERLLAEAARVKDLAGVDFVYLQAQVTAAGAAWRSKVVGGWVELLGADRRAGQAQGLRLHLERVNYWEESAESSLYIRSHYTVSPTGSGARVYNTLDGSYGNWVQLNADRLGGDLPVPVRLVFDSNYGGQGTLYSGQNVSSDPANLAPGLQGEDAAAVAGVTKANQSSSLASGGAYARLTWSGTSDVAVLEFPLLAAMVEQLGGWPFLPLVRLANAITAGEKFWTYWRVIHRHVSGDNVLAVSRPVYLAEEHQLQEGAPLHLPPWVVVAGDTQTGLYLQLRVQAAAATAHTLDVDQLFLLPLEYWRIYRNSVSYLSGLRIEDDGYRGVVKSYGSIQGHTVEGPGFWLWPGRANRCFFLMEGVSSGIPIANYATVYFYARARKRAL